MWVKLFGTRSSFFFGFQDIFDDLMSHLNKNYINELDLSLDFLILLNAMVIVLEFICPK